MWEVEKGVLLVFMFNSVYNFVGEIKGIYRKKEDIRS